MHTPLQMPQKVLTFGDRMKAIFKSNPSKNGKPPKTPPKVQEKPLVLEVSNRGVVLLPDRHIGSGTETNYGDNKKRTNTSPKTGKKSAVAVPLAVSKSESPADRSPEKYSQIEHKRAQQRDEAILENDRLQGQCTHLFEQLQQEREEKNELEENNRETCSRLEQQRDEAVRLRKELTQQVARLEERLSEAQKLQSTTQGQCTRLFDQLQRQREEKNEFERQNREMCSRLEQQRDEALRMREELTQQVARLEEPRFVAQKLQ